MGEDEGGDDDVGDFECDGVFGVGRSFLGALESIERDDGISEFAGFFGEFGDLPKDTLSPICFDEIYVFKFCILLCDPLHEIIRNRFHSSSVICDHLLCPPMGVF